MKVCKSCNKNENETIFAVGYRYCSLCHSNYKASRKNKKSRERNYKLSHVYFVQSGDLIKIGYTEDLPSRISNLQVNNPTIVQVLKTIPGGYKEEQQLHVKFAHLNKTGEWFYAVQELLDFINIVDTI